jgi:uncharacterized alkaline shock family protein YloU
MSLVVDRSAGAITVPNSVLVQIAVRAAESLPGVRVRRKRAVDVDALEVRLELAATRGEPLTAVAEQVQRAVSEALRTMCGLDMSVNVAVEELV